MQNMDFVSMTGIEVLAVRLLFLVKPCVKPLP